MAIARDAFTNGSSGGASTSSLSYNHTCTGSNLILVVVVFTADVADPVTGVTYNGVTMTQTKKLGTQFTNQWMYIYHLLNPATGSNSVSISANLARIWSGSVSYTGVLQSGQPDATNTNTNTSTGSYVTSVTTIADKCWVVEHVYDGSASMQNVSAGTNSSLVGRVGDANPVTAIYDNQGVGAVTPAGSFSMTQTHGTTDSWASVIASFSPAATVASTASSATLQMMGV